MTTTRTLLVGVGAGGRAQALAVPAFELRTALGTLRRTSKVFRGVRRVRVGHAAEADFTVEDDSVSGIHCELSCDLDGFSLRDLGSKNGLWLGGRRIQGAWLAEEDEFYIGRTRVRFRVLKETDSQPLSERSSFGALRGQSWVMRELYGNLERAAAVDTPVLLEGETGSGKDAAFEAMVDAGPRRDGPIEVVDCAALSPSLAEAELFGHAPGAFTGAVTGRPGAFERANGGSLLLDHVEELAPAIQPRLLGLLERRSVQRLGGNKRMAFDVRVYATTQRSLEVEMNQGRFRADLFYRLSGIHLIMPPLRERLEDIPLLIGHFLQQLPRSRPLAPDLMEKLSTGSWHGNVRELRARVERAIADVPLPEAPTPPGVDLDTPYHQQKEQAVSTFEATYLASLLEAAHGNITEASRRAGLSRVHMYELLRKHGLRNPR